MSLRRLHSRFRLLPVLAACAVCLGATSQSCKIGRQIDDEQDLSFATELRLEDQNGELEDTFGPGEPVRFVLNVRNRLDESVTLDFDTTRTHDFIVVIRDTDTIVWQASAVNPPVSTPTRVSFGANETVQFTTDWNQTDSGNNLLQPGDYEARGVVLFDFDEFDTDPLAQNQLGSILIPFTIE